MFEPGPSCTTLTFIVPFVVHAANVVYERCDRFRSEIEDLEERLRDRLSRGEDDQQSQGMWQCHVAYLVRTSVHTPCLSS